MQNLWHRKEAWELIFSEKSRETPEEASIICFRSKISSTVIKQQQTGRDKGRRCKCYFVERASHKSHLFNNIVLSTWLNAWVTPVSFKWMSYFLPSFLTLQAVAGLGPCFTLYLFSAFNLKTDGSLTELLGDKDKRLLTIFSYMSRRWRCNSFHRKKMIITIPRNKMFWSIPILNIRK